MLLGAAGLPGRASGPAATGRRGPGRPSQAAGTVPDVADQSHSLYRKYRPQSLDELRGQEHISAALRNALKEDRVGHAYLFSGPRGTGKTTTARILAKALNCLDLTPSGDPCCACVNCVAVAEHNFADLQELDAA